jgi:hypothetical protein
MTDWRIIAEKTGKENELGHYVPAGMHECGLCNSYDDPRRILIGLPNKYLSICLTCARPYMDALLSRFLDDELIDPLVIERLENYPVNPYRKDAPPPVRPFEKIKESIEGKLQEGNTDG